MDILDLEKNEEEEIIDDLVNESEDEQEDLHARYEISSYGADFDVEGLVKRLERGDIYIPDFQRKYVWNQKEASRFIESLLLGLPVPGIFLARNPESNKLLVIDGQQRLKTLQFFFTGFFDPHDKERKLQIFRLIHVQKQFEGLTYETLNELDKVKLNDSLIHATIIKQESPESDDTSIFHIFERLNSEGKRLTPQEIRTAVYHGKLIDCLKKLNEYSYWRRIFGKKNIRLRDQELILRFLAFYFQGDKYSSPLNEFLNVFCTKYKNPTDVFLQQCEALFENTIDVIWHSIGSKAFRLDRPFNAAVFDSIMVGLAKRLAKDPSINYESVKQVYDGLLENQEYTKSVSFATSDENNVSFRLKTTIQEFNKI